GLGGGGDRLRVTEIAAGARCEVRVELVEQRYTRRDVELHDLALAHLIEHLHHGAQAVTVRHDEHVAARAQLRGDAGVPKRQYAREGVLERLGRRQLLASHARVTRIEA